MALSGALRASVEVGAMRRRSNFWRLMVACRMGTWFSGPQAFGYSATLQSAPTSAHFALMPFSIVK